MNLLEKAETKNLWTFLNLLHSVCPIESYELRIGREMKISCPTPYLMQKNFTIEPLDIRMTLYWIYKRDLLTFYGLFLLMSGLKSYGFACRWGVGYGKKRDLFVILWGEELPNMFILIVMNIESHFFIYFFFISLFFGVSSFLLYFLCTFYSVFTFFSLHLVLLLN